MKKEDTFLPDKFILKDGGTITKEKTGAIRKRVVGKGRFDLISPYALLRVARIYEKGAIKYHTRNQEKGLKFSSYLDSAIRHIIQYMMGMTDEDHMAQAMWNVMQILHQEALIDFGLLPKELNNLPLYQQRNAEQLKALLSLLEVDREDEK